jgi:hypothetical protein
MSDAHEDVSLAAAALADLQRARDEAAEAERRADLEYVANRIVEAVADGLDNRNFSRQWDETQAKDEAKERSPKVSSGNGQAKGQAAPPELHIISVASLAGKPVPPREWFVPDVIIANRVGSSAAMAATENLYWPHSSASRPSRRPIGLAICPSPAVSSMLRPRMILTKYTAELRT